MASFEWTPIRYRNVISVLKNPFYAGAYAYGKSEKRTAVVDGHLRRSYGHGRPLERWEVLIKDHHEGYIEWAESERNQAALAANAYGKRGGAKSGRGGRALLAGLIGLRALRPAPAGRLRRARPPTAGVPLRPPEPDARPAALPGVRRRPHRRRRRGGVAAGAGADGDRGGAGGGASPHGELRRSGSASSISSCSKPATRPRSRSAASGLRPGEPAHRRAAGAELGGGAAAGRRVPGAARRRARRPIRRGRAPDFTGLAEDLSAAWNAPATTMRTRQRLAARLGHGHRRRCRRGNARGRPGDPLEGRPALGTARQEAQDRRARLQHARGGAGGDAQHGDAVVRRGHRRVAQPDGHAHRPGEVLDGQARQLAAPRPRHARLPLRREGRRVADHVGGRGGARRHATTSSAA